MRDETLAHLYDILHAAQAVRAFVAKRTFNDYVADELFRSAVERKFQIMGEALTRIRRDDPEILRRIRDYRDIISFRNILVHGYDVIEDRIVWGMIQDDLDGLIADIEQLLPLQGGGSE